MLYCFGYVYNQLISIKCQQRGVWWWCIGFHHQKRKFRNGKFQDSPAVNFWLTTSGNTDSGLGEECSGLWQWEVPGLSLCVGLPQNGVQRLLFAGLMPSIGSNSNDLFRVAHAIFSLYVNCLKTLSDCYTGFRGVLQQILELNNRTALLHRYLYCLIGFWCL